MLEKHEKDYKTEAWKHYTINELGLWVHLLSKRAVHRESLEKATKDLYDAKNYHFMIGENLKKICKDLGIDYDKL